MGRALANDRPKRGRATATRRSGGKAAAVPVVSVDDALRWLERHGKRSTIEGMARYGIPSAGAYGVTFGELRGYARQIGRDHALAAALWAVGRYEARLLAALVDDPAQVTVRQMDSWAADFENWGDCDTVCFHLFDRTPHAWSRVRAWSSARALFTKRAAFALLWGLTRHDRAAPDRAFLDCLPLIEAGALDERDLVKKAVDMSLRALGKRNQTLRRAAVDLADRLARSTEGSQAWIGRSALRELAGRRG
jgi:3-methyladenine DNA glycosylase AlkD